MSSTGENGSVAKYVFKGWYGAKVQTQAVKEASHEEIDAFIRELLGVTDKGALVR